MEELPQAVEPLESDEPGADIAEEGEKAARPESKQIAGDMEKTEEAEELEELPSAEE